MPNPPLPAPRQGATQAGACPAHIVTDADPQHQPTPHCNGSDQRQRVDMKWQHARLAAGRLTLLPVVPLLGRHARALSRSIIMISADFKLERDRSPRFATFSDGILSEEMATPIPTRNGCLPCMTGAKSAFPNNRNQPSKTTICSVRRAGGADTAPSGLCRVPSASRMLVLEVKDGADAIRHADSTQSPGSLIAASAGGNPLCRRYAPKRRGAGARPAHQPAWQTGDAVGVRWCDQHQPPAVRRRRAGTVIPAHLAICRDESTTASSPKVPERLGRCPRILQRDVAANRPGAGTVSGNSPRVRRRGQFGL